MGRNRKPKDRKKSIHLSLRIGTSLRAQLDKAAGARGVSVGEFARQAVEAWIATGDRQLISARPGTVKSKGE